MPTLVTAKPIIVSVLREDEPCETHRLYLNENEIEGYRESLSSGRPKAGPGGTTHPPGRHDQDFDFGCDDVLHRDQYGRGR
jgi:hypothetical protein